MNESGTNSGHGHVWERPDGLKARCGGPALCAECKVDSGLVQHQAALPSVNLEDLERIAIVQALAACNGNRTHAAKALGVCVRTLQRKMNALGLQDATAQGLRTSKSVSSAI